MLHMISQGGFAVTVNERGGQLVSIVNEGTEYLLHQGFGTAATLNNTLHFFPVIGPAPGDGFRYNGAKHRMQGAIGLLHDWDFNVEEKEFEYLSLVFRSNEVTKAKYPFDFLFNIQYRIVGKRLAVTYEVQNQSLRNMYFSVGGQLSLKLPFEEPLTVHDYALEFSDACEPRVYDIAQNEFCDGAVAHKLVNGKRLPFDPALFDGRAKVLTSIPPAVAVKSRTGLRGLRLHYNDMCCLGVRCVNERDPHVVVQVLTAMQQRKGPVKDISDFEGITVLTQGGMYRNEWSITVE